MTRVILGAALLFLCACGDDVGSDAAELCVEVALTADAPLRAQAVYHAGDAPPEVIDDVAIEDGVACLTLRPPSAPAHRMTHTIPVTFFLFEVRALEPLVTDAVPIDIGVYADRDASQSLGAGDRMRSILSSQDRARVPLWLDGAETFLDEQPPFQVPEALAKLAPGGRPFAFSGAIETAVPWSGRGTILLRPWPRPLVVPPTAPGTPCDRALSWPRCRVLENVDARATARLVDPRVDPARLTVEASGFDPQVPLPPAEVAVPAEVIARDCATVDDLLVAREVVSLPQQSPDRCECTVWERVRWVIAVADDPPPWLTCGGRPLDGEAADALAEQAGVR